MAFSRPFSAPATPSPVPSSGAGTPPSIALRPRHDSAAFQQPKGKERTWWREASIYQIYLPSFKDADGDGWGDLRGVTSKVDYLATLGVDIIWLSPIFESPMKDMGYDVSDYYAVRSPNTMQDFQELVKTIHENDMKIIIDVAFNHSSVENPWFQESLEAARKPEYDSRQDWYIWRSPRYDDQGNRLPPSNWRSVFEGNMWEYDEQADKYYLHVFGKMQPDLNWDNPELREKIYDTSRFWLDQGIDGFRLDAINLISKVPGFPDIPESDPYYDPEHYDQRANDMFANGPNVHKYLQEYHDKVFAHYDIVTLGEMSCGITSEQAIEFTSINKNEPELDLCIQFQHVELDCIDGDKWILRDWALTELKAITNEWQTGMIKAGCWPTVWMENHDQPRAISRFTRTTLVYRLYCAKLLAMYLLTLQGTVLIYQGQELGLTNPEEFSKERLKDIETLIFWERVNKSPDEEESEVLENAKHAIKMKGRDAGRVPMPWNNSEHGGFTDPGSKPWLPALEDFKQWNAEKQTQDSNSVYCFYQRMISLRKEYDSLIYGDFVLIDAENLSIYSYIRGFAEDQFLVVLNFTAHDVVWKIPEDLGDPQSWRLMLSTYPSGLGLREVLKELELQPFEGRLYRFDGEDGKWFNEESVEL